MKDATVRMTPEQQRLVEKNVDLALFLAQRAHQASGGSSDLDEYVSAAYEGLALAASRFDPTRANVVDGVPDVEGAFAGFARRRINGAIIDSQRSADHVPRRQRSAYKNLQTLGLGTGRSAGELSDTTGMPVDRIQMIIHAVENTPISLDGAEILPLDIHAEQDTLEARLRSRVTEVFDRLPELQQIVVALRYYEGLDLKVIAQMIDVRLSVLRAAHTEALLALHDVMVHEAS